MIDINNILAASIKYTPMTDIPFLTSWASGDATAMQLVNQLFMLSITLGAMLAVFMFVWGGLDMIMATDNPGKITKGKGKMVNAILGLLMLLSTYLVLNTINSQITSLEFKGNDFKLLPQENRGLVEYGALYENNAKQMSILCSNLKNDGRQVANLQKVKEACRKWAKLKVNEISALESKLADTENLNCSRSRKGGCYVGDCPASEVCFLKPVPKSEPVEDGGFYLSPGKRTDAEANIRKYSSMDACELSRLKEVRAGRGSHLVCFKP